MSALHVLERSGTQFRVAIHVTIPGTNNAAGIPWATVLIKSGLGGRTVLADGTGSDGGISSAEKTSITAGTVFEIVDTISPPSNATTSASINAWLDDYAAAKASEAQALIQATLNQYGRVR